MKSETGQGASCGESMAVAGTNRHAMKAMALLVALVLAFAASLVGAGQAHALVAGKPIAVGQTFTKGGNVYKITEYNPKKKGEMPDVTLVKFGSANKKPYVNTVMYQGIRFEVDVIGKNAFNNERGRKITSVTIGGHVDRIGAKAFAGCKKLKVVNMRKSDVIEIKCNGCRYVIDEIDAASNAFTKAGVKSIKVHCGSSSTCYQKLFKTALLKCGMRKSVRVVK